MCVEKDTVSILQTFLTLYFSTRMNAGASMTESLPALNVFLRVDVTFAAAAILWVMPVPPSAAVAGSTASTRLKIKTHSIDI